VPRCELLMTNTAARGTIRAGQFSQIPNVVQAGGEDGMWTFDRYQRWMEGKSDWVRPVATPAADSGTFKAASPGLRPAPAQAPGARPTRAAQSGAPEPRPRADPLAPADAAERSSEITIDEDIDLEELAALAKKIEDRSR
jgi:twitching motility protein PilT